MIKVSVGSGTVHESMHYKCRLLFIFFSGIFRGVCKDIDHFPDDADYEQDAAEYLLSKLQMSVSNSEI